MTTTTPNTLAHLTRRERPGRPLPIFRGDSRHYTLLWGILSRLSWSTAGQIHWIGVRTWPLEGRRAAKRLCVGVNMTLSMQLLAELQAACPDRPNWHGVAIYPSWTTWAQTEAMAPSTVCLSPGSF